MKDLHLWIGTVKKKIRKKNIWSSNHIRGSHSHPSFAAPRPEIVAIAQWCEMQPRAASLCDKDGHYESLPYFWADHAKRSFHSPAIVQASFFVSDTGTISPSVLWSPVHSTNHDSVSFALLASAWYMLLVMHDSSCWVLQSPSKECRDISSFY